MPLHDFEILLPPPLLTGESMLRSMGVASAVGIKPRLLRHVDEAIERVSSVARPALVWSLATVDSMRADLPESRRLDRYLESADHVVAVAGTAGREMEAMLAGEPDPMRKYVLSVAATALARQTLEQIQVTLTVRFPNGSIGQPLSPGNAGLPLKAQGPLLGLLPLESIGIEYDEDARVMTPLASVSALIGLGSYVRSGREGCPSCPSSDCPLRLAPRDAATIAA